MAKTGLPLFILITSNAFFQAEHGPDSQVVLVIAGDGVDLNAIQEEIMKQCQALPRGEFALKALSHSFTVLARDMLEVCLLFVDLGWQQFAQSWMYTCCHKIILPEHNINNQLHHICECNIPYKFLSATAFSLRLKSQSCPGNFLLKHVCT